MASHRDVLLRLGNELGAADPSGFRKLVVDALAGARRIRAGRPLPSHRSWLRGSGTDWIRPRSAARAAHEAALASGDAIEQATAEGSPLRCRSRRGGARDPAAVQVHDSDRRNRRSGRPVRRRSRRRAPQRRRARAPARRRRSRRCSTGRTHRARAEQPAGGVKLYGRLIEQSLAKAGDGYGEGLARRSARRSTALQADHRLRRARTSAKAASDQRRDQTPCCASCSSTSSIV